MLAEY